MSSKKINTFASIDSSSNNEISCTKIAGSDVSSILEKFKKNEKYEHMAVVGQGGMGQVTLSRDISTLRKVAIKTLKDDLLKNHEAVIRFTEEAQITAQLEHPNIIPVYEMGLDKNDAPFYSMKYVKGTNLKEILKLIKENNQIIIKKFHIIELLNIFIKVCDAMSFACSKGVLHRDLKPENIMIGEFGEVLIVDWGLAKTYPLTVDSSNTYDKTKISKKIDLFISENIDTIRSINNVKLSMDDCLIGTPQYMAPERIIGKGDERSETFALGTILHDILVLKNMFTATEVKEVLQKIANGEYEDMSKFKKLPHIPGGKIPPALIAVVTKATQKDPSQRYKSITELKNEIEAYILGFATKAESAGFLRLLKLGIIRHKKISFMLVLFIFSLFFVSGVFIYELVHSRQDALNKSIYASVLKETAHRRSAQVSSKSKVLQLKVNELKNLSDIIMIDALHESDQLDFKKALRQTLYAIELNPHKEEYYLHLGRIYLTLLSFDKAIEAFNKITKSPKIIKRSQDFLEMSKILSAKTLQGVDALPIKVELYEFLKSKGEFSESIAVLNTIQDHSNLDTYLTEIWKLRLGKGKLKQVLLNEKTSIKAQGGKFKIVFQNAPLFDLTPLIGMPISDLTITNCRINNLDALKDMPLEALSLNNTGVNSLKPVENMQLLDLKLKNLNITDLKPLKGMNLRKLSISNCPVQDLSPIAGIKTIDRLTIENTLVNNLGPLREMRLTYLNAQNTKIKNINPLRGMPLKILLLNSTPMNNISALNSISPQILEMNDTLVTVLPEMNVSKLEVLSVNDSPLKNISALKNALLLKEIMLSNTQVTNLGVLRGKNLESVHITGTPVSKIAPVVNGSLKRLYITGSYVSDLRPLTSATKLEILNANNCGISNIDSLKKLQLKEVDLSGNKNLSSISALENSKLKIVNLSRTSICDLSPLKNQPIRILNLEKTNIDNLSIVSGLTDLKELNVLDCKRLTSVQAILDSTSIENLKFYPYIKDAYKLENHPSIKLFSIAGNSRLAKPFWLMYKKKYLNDSN